MAMTKRGWSVSALAVEFGIDRRTVAKRVEGIAPAGVERGSPVWLLADVAPAIMGAVEPDETGIDEAKRRKALAEARLAEFAVEREAGRMLAREDVDAAVIASFARVRTRLLSVPHKCAPLVQGQDVATASETIRAAIWAALAELSQTSVAEMTRAPTARS